MHATLRMHTTLTYVRHTYVCTLFGAQEGKRIHLVRLLCLMTMKSLPW